MKHKSEIAKVEEDISRHLRRAKDIAKQCSFWNDVGILDALISNDEVVGCKSPLRDNAVFPNLPPEMFRQMSRQALFTGVVLLARYARKEDFKTWSAGAQLPVVVSGIPMYRIDLSKLRHPCDMWISIMRAFLSLAYHRTLIKDEIYDQLFGTKGRTCMWKGIRVRETTAKSVERYEYLKQVSPLTYGQEATSKGPMHCLCRYYGSAAKDQNAKRKLSKVISFSYALYLLSKIHRSQKPNQILTFLSADAILDNLFGAGIGLPAPTTEEVLLGIDTQQPLYLRAYESVCKLMGLARQALDEEVLREIGSLLKRFAFDPMTYQEPFVALPYNSVIIQATEDGCVFFDDVDRLIPGLAANYLLGSGELYNLKGEAFRSHIESVVGSKGLTPFRVSRVKRHGQIIGDVDVGFVRNGHLCLIECKDVAPYPSLLLDREDEVLRSITHRKNGYIAWASKIKELQEYFLEFENLKKLAKDKHFDATQVKGVVGFIVTNRPVFIYLMPDMLLTACIPKVMVKEELEVLLSKYWAKILPHNVMDIKT